MYWATVRYACVSVLITFFLPVTFEPMVQFSRNSGSLYDMYINICWSHFRDNCTDRVDEFFSHRFLRQCVYRLRKINSFRVDEFHNSNRSFALRQWSRAGRYTYSTQSANVSSLELKRTCRRKNRSLKYCDPVRNEPELVDLMPFKEITTVQTLSNGPSF